MLPSMHMQYTSIFIVTPEAKRAEKKNYPVSRNRTADFLMTYKQLQSDAITNYTKTGFDNDLLDL
ncbi:hypothetical protein N7478_006585 [Penicillium angulare]|uniref:uncharacterized protein n=1 Tax=Penicillium angulare TaxID=116970 RepID=UPI00254189F4|nr:uncharacterized protein N7478_006585 [Penicillium angulare]KAJ5281213.1 hypothetical protein N7478_006585 [Penicillium angulare]